MFQKCANDCCAVPNSNRDGKLFRLDLEIGNSAGETEHKTAYIWLCNTCARHMVPKVSVCGDTVHILLALTRADTVPVSRSARHVI